MIEVEVVFPAWVESIGVLTEKKTPATLSLPALKSWRMPQYLRNAAPDFWPER